MLELKVVDSWASLKQSSRKTEAADQDLGPRKDRQQSCSRDIDGEARGAIALPRVLT